MDWIILTIVGIIICGLALIVGILIGKHQKEQYIREIDKSIEEKNQQLRNETEKLVEEKTKTLKEITDVSINLAAAQKEYETMRGEMQEKVQIYYQAGMDKAKGELQNYYDVSKLKIDNHLKDLLVEGENKLKAEFSAKEVIYEGKKKELLDDINLINEKLGYLKSSYAAAVENQKREEEAATKQDFYRLRINESDLEDIKVLREIEPRLHNAELLNKLIWTSFYQQPYKDLVGRIMGNRTICGIYKITCLLNKKIYIGKSTDIGKRWSEHIKSFLEIGTIAKTQLYTEMKKFGAENFTFEVLEEVDKDNLFVKESYWISFFQTNTYGLNMKL